jgi:hypothetical protein
MENYKIVITISNELSNDFLDEFEQKLDSSAIEIISHRQSEDEYYNFTGNVLLDILISIKENPESIFIFPAIYDGLKATIIGIWNKLMRTKKNVKENKLVLETKDSKNRVFKIKIEGDFDTDSIEKIVTKSLELLKEDKEIFFENDDLVNTSDENEQIIEMVLNTETGIFEPTNFGEIRREIDEFQKRAEEDFNS